MFLDILLVTALAVINASIPEQQIPIDIQITPVFPQGEEAAVSSSSEAATAEGGGGALPSSGNIVIDAGLITAIAGMAGGMFAAYKKNTSRVDAAADTTVNLAQSLKATDRGNADTAAIVAQIAEKLKNVKNIEEIPKALEACAPAAKQNAEEWKEDVKAYYETPEPPKSEDIGLDKVKTKLAAVNQMTKPTQEPT